MKITVFGGFPKENWIFEPRRARAGPRPESAPDKSARAAREGARPINDHMSVHAPDFSLWAMYLELLGSRTSEPEFTQTAPKMHPGGMIYLYHSGVHAWVLFQVLGVIGGLKCNLVCVERGAPAPTSYRVGGSLCALLRWTLPRRGGGTPGSFGGGPPGALFKGESRLEAAFSPPELGAGFTPYGRTYVLLMSYSESMPGHAFRIGH